MNVGLDRVKSAHYRYNVEKYPWVWKTFAVLDKKISTKFSIQEYDSKLEGLKAEYEQEITNKKKIQQDMLKLRAFYDTQLSSVDGQIAGLPPTAAGNFWVFVICQFIKQNYLSSYIRLIKWYWVQKKKFCLFSTKRKFSFIKFTVHSLLTLYLVTCSHCCM